MTLAPPRRTHRNHRAANGPAVLERVRKLAARPAGLFRVHRDHPALYARARRLFGSWSGAIAAAGLDYPTILAAARRRAVARRKQRRRRIRPVRLGP